MSDQKDLSPQTILQKLKSKEILLVDVREPREFAAERIHGALLFPLSTFDPSCLPADGSRAVVFQCGSGKRSRAALDQYEAETGLSATHMEGGIGAWKQAGLPCVQIDPATGNVSDPGRY